MRPRPNPESVILAALQDLVFTDDEDARYILDKLEEAGLCVVPIERWAEARDLLNELFHFTRREFVTPGPRAAFHFHQRIVEFQAGA